jgi:hypothetical protein
MKATEHDSNSVTPKGDITWYIKWIASIITLVAVSVRASGLSSLAWIDLVGSFIGAAGWLVVGFMWRDRALMVLNGAISVVLLAGILRIFFGTA